MLVASAARASTHSRPMWPRFCIRLVRTSYLNVSRDLKNSTAHTKCFQDRLHKVPLYVLDILGVDPDEELEEE